MEFPLVAAGFIAFFALAVAANYFDTKRRRAAWSLVAHKTGLTFGGDVLQGTLDGVTLTVRVVSRGSGKSRQDYTVFLMNLGAFLPNALSIQPEGMFDKVAKLIGSQDVQLGLPEIDPKLMVKAADADEAQAWAQQAKVMRGLKRLVDLRAYTFKLAANQLSFERRGAVVKASELEHLVRELVTISNDLAPSRPPSQAEALGDESDVNLW